MNKILAVVVVVVVIVVVVVVDFRSTLYIYMFINLHAPTGNYS